MKPNTIMPPAAWLVILFVLIAVPLLAAVAIGGVETAPASPWEMAWANDSTWYDGEAEYAVYESERTIYGTVRSYETVIITNKQYMDPKTTTKAADWKAPGMIEVFKHNVREVIPTENYDYKFLTTSFSRTDTLAPFKMTMSSQEDCGATFKQFVVDGARLKADQYVYFPDGGHLEEIGRIDESFHFFDELSLVLRGYPWSGIEAKNGLSIQLLPEQTDTHRTAMAPVVASARLRGAETLNLPVGAVEAYCVEIRGQSGDVLGTFWFAADAGAPWLHILVQYEGADGLRHRLKSTKRWAYWER